MEASRLRRDLECVTGARSLSEGETLAGVLERLDAAATGPLPERLAHYLQKRSYVKALQWLDAPEMPHHP